jgi:hypothetical protein
MELSVAIGDVGAASATRRLPARRACGGWFFRRMPRHRGRGVVGDVELGATRRASVANLSALLPLTSATSSSRRPVLRLVSPSRGERGGTTRRTRRDASSALASRDGSPGRARGEAESSDVPRVAPVVASFIVCAVWFRSDGARHAWWEWVGELPLVALIFGYLAILLTVMLVEGPLAWIREGWRGRTRPHDDILGSKRKRAASERPDSNREPSIRSASALRRSQPWRRAAVRRRQQ